MHARIKFILVILTLFSFISVAQAAPLGLILEDSPDIMSSFIDVTYDSSSELFVASGYALDFNDDNVPPTEVIGGAQSFLLSASIDNSGNAFGGSVTIDGTVLGYGPPLLTGTLTNFGFLDGINSNDDELFEFEFTVTGGGLAIPAYYGLPGSTFGLILTTRGSTFDGAWDHDFDNLPFGPGSGEGLADAAPIVPEPATLSLLMLGLLGICRRGRD